ncbi:hypothetical protein [Desulfolucanica intricata]|uniref:hypothetical protein n=1 Tax=Desulfolucanica intricata TaxID=1285191 RepID=UPI0008310BA6|nr:hypothetical protein [Desulfolucanica intricata]
MNSETNKYRLIESSGPHIPPVSLLIKEIPESTEQPEIVSSGDYNRDDAKHDNLKRDDSKKIILLGELIKNNNFEQWASMQKVSAWEGFNITKTEDSLTDAFAVRLGNNPVEAAQLFQDINILPGHYFELKFTLKLPLSLLEEPTAKVIWLDQNKELLDTGLSMKISKNKKNYYGLYTRITLKSPEKAAYARVIFEKNGYGVVIIDEVSLICHSIYFKG